MSSRINYKLGIIFLMITFISLSLISGYLGPNIKFSNESIQAKELLNQAEKDIFEMISKNISSLRVNETYQEAFQLYSAQLALEETERKADYKLVIKYTSEISSIKKIAIEANDELKIFKETVENTRKETNLSKFEEEYNQIILSFNEERFEETLELIKNGYDRISEIQSSQTATNVFYLSTISALRDFFVKNKFEIAIIGSLILFLLFIFWNTFKKLMKRVKFNNLIIQKNAINGLIKKIQESYFKTKKISENEYKIKLKKFEELTRDIDRQIMVLKEEIFKINKK
jgi:hypothetical protein